MKNPTPQIRILEPKVTVFKDFVYIYANAIFQTRLQSFHGSEKTDGMAPKNALKRENNVHIEYETKLPGQFWPKNRIRIMP